MKTKRMIASILLLTAALFSGALAQQTSAQRGQTEIKELDCWGAPTAVPIVRIKILGTYLTYLRPGGKADRNGLHLKDVIVKINGRTSTNPQVLNSQLSMFSNTSKRIEYFRLVGGSYRLEQVLINDGPGWNYTGQSLKGAARGTGGSHLTQTEMENYMVKLINEDRAKNGFTRPLRTSSGLGRMARSYADDMAKRDFRGHKDPEGRNQLERARLAGITSLSIFENCAYPGPLPNSFAMVKQGEEQLMESEGHRSQVLEASAVCVGVGIAYRQDGGLKIVQVFSADEVP
ncbi:MAG: hypothetical protein K2X93_03200 [Candidatus Obscuribacterales bacterium]|nr:hypothetical protein [Candidatus Obscuribacterales bacterium]